MDDKQRSEEAAKRIVGAVLDVQVERIDGPGAPNGSPDFELHLDDGAVALEVTRSTDPVYRSFSKAASRTKWQIEGLASSWQIITGYGYVNVGELRKGLARVLPRLEAQVIYTFGERDDPDYSADAAALIKLGVRRGRVVELEGVEPTVFLSKAGAFVTGADVLNDLCQREVANNVVKLRDRGHLFVWVDSLSHEASTAMDLHRPPRNRPALPPGLTVWVARQAPSGKWEPDRLWRLPPGQPWEIVQA